MSHPDEYRDPPVEPNYGRNAAMGDKVAYAKHDLRRAANTASQVLHAQSSMEALTDLVNSRGAYLLDDLATTAKRLENHADRLLGECPPSPGHDNAETVRSYAAGAFGELQRSIDRVMDNIAEQAHRISNAAVRGEIA